MLWCALGAAVLAGCGDDGAPIAATCSDGVQNGGESGVDCGGGACGACAEGDGCLQHGDCATGVCGAGGTCVAQSCSDGLVNGDETDADCGGSCDGCATGARCQAGDDCATGMCADGRCAAASCGDGVVNGAEACDAGGESAACNADCSAASCGDSVVNNTAGETCDEGGTATATCDADCTLRSCGDSVVNDDAGETCDTGGNSATCDFDCTAAVCGDSYVNAAAGEECDDGNTVTGDGCDDQCAAEFVTVAPRAISGALGCSLAYSYAGRKVAIDGQKTVYVAMHCDGAAHIAVSHDLGVTYSAPRPVGITDVREVAVESSPGGTAYVAAVTASGELVFTRSTDGGLTWEAPRLLTTGVEIWEDPGLSIDSLGDSVFITTSIDGVLLRVLRNHSRGAGAFDSVDVATTNVSLYELICDEDSGDVFLAYHVGDSKVLRRSTDGAASFGSEFTPPGAALTDWAGGGSFLYAVSGDATDIDVISTSDLSTGFAVNGLPRARYRPERAIDADALGNAYVVTTTYDSLAIQLDRLLAGAASISSADGREISASGYHPGVAAVPSNNGAVVVFNQGTTVMAAVQVY